MRWIAADTRTGARAGIAWIAGACVLGFLVSFLSVSLASLPRDGFVLAHALVGGTYLALYSQRAGFGPAELRRNWPLGLTVGALAAAFSVSFVLSQPGSPGLQGSGQLVGIVWLGVVYGALDALLLTVLPVHAAWCTARALGWPGRPAGWIAATVLAVCASLLVTFAYHLGFPEFRGAGLIHPLIGNTVITLAYVLSASPVAPILAHVALHVAAVVHAYATSIPLPPHY